MGLPWISSIGVILFVMFIGNAMWTMSQLFMKLECSSVPCYQSFLAKQPKMQLALFTSTTSNPISSETKKLLNIHKFNYFETFNKEVEIEVPLKTRRNGTLHMQVVLALDGPPVEWKTLKRDGPTVIHSVSLTEYMVPKAETFNLLSESESTPAKEPTKKSKRLATDAAKTAKPVTHIATKAPVTILTDFITLSQEDVPPELAHLIRVNRYGEILPIIKSDFFNTRLKDLVQVTKNMTEFTVSFEYKPISIGKLRLMLLVEHATKSMLTLGFTNKDLDDVKKMFSDTNAVLLSATLLVGCVHLLFDFLSFKNDVVFWRRKKTYEGLSTRTTLWRAFSQIVIFFYLMDENTSLLVVIPAGIGAFIELWKCKKILKLEFNMKGLRKITSEVDGKEEKKTAEFDREAMRYLSYLLYPLCIAGAAYSLIYQPHKSWYSWTLNSLVNGVYAFDFLFMLPQLFVNYKLKSVAALPWRSFMYKAFNTFIDDLFAFIITMPTAHRLACFRDDVVFVIYLYQRWLYPVDKNRDDSGAAIEQIPATEQPDEATEALLDSEKKNK